MRKELTALRRTMQAHNIDAYLIPTTDFHGSEYVNDYFKCRRYISGFTGSAGTLVVTADWAGLWTDGRYFLQAAAELDGSGIELMKMGEPGVPTPEEYLDTLDNGTSLGFDGRIVSAAFASKLRSSLLICHNLDLVDEIWTDRPAIQPSPIYPLDLAVTGESHESKLSRIRKIMEEKGADYHLMTSLEEIAWLYNLRGRDVKNTPVFFAFALITAEEARLYIMDGTYKDSKTYPYFHIFEDLKKLKPGKMLLDENTVSYSLLKSLPDSMDIINDSNPAQLMKALKNETEIAATKKAHLKDGAAMTNFLCWLKNYDNVQNLTEIAASDYLEKCRREQKGCFDLSFDTISGYAENGAIIHYSATPETDKPLQAKGFLLVDSGGQYEDGTTDITRTIALGPLTEEMKLHYTAVLRAHIQLAMARFARGTTGAELDVIARKPLHDMGLDFNHGTGHGVGHLLSVHEGPNTISPRGTKSPILPGMITSDEPGLYFEGKYGIRLENEILCTEAAGDAEAAGIAEAAGDAEAAGIAEAVENAEAVEAVENPKATGGFGNLGFETITFCPFDREAIIADRLLPEERQWLNHYHRTVYEKISPLVDAKAQLWLAEATKEI